MCSRKKTGLKTLPTIFISAILIISGFLKITGLHPMIPHFTEMGLYSYIEVLGAMELFFAILFLVPQTSLTGLLLLTAYLGGAMASELRFGMIAAPAVPLVLVWIAAFLRHPSLFRFSKNNIQLS